MIVSLDTEVEILLVPVEIRLAFVVPLLAEVETPLRSLSIPALTLPNELPSRPTCLDAETSRLAPPQMVLADPTVELTSRARCPLILSETLILLDK